MRQSSPPVISERKAAVKQRRSGPAQVAAGHLVILWGVPGTGKSTFARWMRDEHGYEHVDNDKVFQTLSANPPAPAWTALTPLERAWTVLAQGRIPPEAFIRTVAASSQPVVVEYGMFADQRGIEQLGQLRTLGAEAWWFDGDREAAKQGWREENRMSSRQFPDEAWDNVVKVIEDNWPLLVQFFGARMLRTVERGPLHLAPEETYATMAALVRPPRSASTQPTVTSPGDILIGGRRG